MITLLGEYYRIRMDKVRWSKELEKAGGGFLYG